MLQVHDRVKIIQIDNLKIYGEALNKTGVVTDVNSAYCGSPIAVKFDKPIRAYHLHEESRGSSCNGMGFRENQLQLNLLKICTHKRVYI